MLGRRESIEKELLRRFGDAARQTLAILLSEDKYMNKRVAANDTDSSYARVFLVLFPLLSLLENCCPVLFLMDVVANVKFARHIFCFCQKQRSSTLHAYDVA